jgi:formylglycine-generating enzyme required for sulfatase activity
MSGTLELREGAVFAGDFRVVRPLSRGGMGAVYVVEQLSTGSRRALKLMLPDLAQDESFRARFAQEARIGARIESDHVVQVIGAGVDADTGAPWLAMELLKGETLHAMRGRTGALAPALVREIMMQLGHAVAAAHAQGIVHRDLKPENIFLAVPRREGAALTVKVLDFGIAKLVAEAHTHTTSTLGTPRWMAPEQTDAGATISPATDVWALGLIAFDALAGRSYWRAARGETNPMMLLREVVFAPIAAASERARELGVEKPLPAGFDEWFARCVCREVDRRFRDAREAIEALDGVLPQGTEPVILRPHEIGVDIDAFGSTEAQPSRDPVAVSTAKPRRRAVPEATKRRRDLRGWLLGGGTISAALVALLVVWKARAPGSVAPPPSAPAPRATTTPLSSCPPGMALIPGGTFFLALKRTGASVATFCLDRSEVTAAEYDACVKRGACTGGTERVEWAGLTDKTRNEWSRFCNTGRDGRGAHPINCVDWNQATTYCASLERRLPTEEEWEWAARGGNNAWEYPWGSEPPKAGLLNACGRECVALLRGRKLVLDDVALYAVGDAFPETAPVGSFPAGDNPWGVHDLAGNVWEWTSSRSETDDTMRICRGGGWQGNVASRLTVGERSVDSPAHRYADVGFRCAKGP